MSEPYMTIRQMCEAYDVTARTLRFYEAKELLHPVRQGQKRLFTKADRARLTLILRGKRFGFSLEEIRQVLDLYDGKEGQAAQLTRTSELGQQRLVGLREERERVESAIAELQDLVSWAQSELRRQSRTKAA